jgi:hypothetical protein
LPTFGSWQSPGLTAKKSRFVNEKILVSLFSVNQLFLADSSWPDGNLFKRIVPLELTFSTLKNKFVRVSIFFYSNKKLN